MNDLYTGYHGVRVAVLGASGFIGRWVARYLSEMGASLDLIVRDVGRGTSICSQYGIQGRLHLLDLRDFDALSILLRELQPAIIFNLAGYGIDKSEKDPEISAQINVHLVGVICEVMARIREPSWGGQNILHVGSALEYGSAKGDLSEDTRPNPTTLYGISKLAGTQALARFSKAYHLKSLTARLFTVYGPGEHAGRLLPSLMEIARTGDALQLTAGYQKRDFTYITDIAEGLLRLGLVETHPGEIVNLATGVLSSVKDFVATAAEILGILPEKLHFGEIPSYWQEMEHDPISILRLEQLTTWRPGIGIAEGIIRTVNFQEDNLNAGD